MYAVSCIANFKENFTKNLPYCKLLHEQISAARDFSSVGEPFIAEHASLCASKPDCLITKICEGYQFTIAFFGELCDTYSLKNTLTSCGYRFTYGSDAELALYAYIHFGKNCVIKFSGSFAFVVYDSMRRQIFAANDPISSIPLYYGQIRDSTVICTCINGILDHPDMRARISGNGINCLLCAAKDSADDIFEDIFTLKPSHTLKIKESGTTVSEYVPKSDTTRGLVPYGSFFFAKEPPHETSAVLVGDENEGELLQLLSARAAKDFLKVSAYSFTLPSLRHHSSVSYLPLTLDESSVYAALESCVLSCGVPVLSESDYLFATAFKQINDYSRPLAVIRPLKPSVSRILSRFFSEGDCLFPQVAETLCGTLPPISTPLNIPFMLSQNLSVIPITPLLTPPHKADTPSIVQSPAQSFIRRIFLDIISKNNSPISAFFKKSALLKLYESGLDAENCGLYEFEIMSYIIKLNIWFEKYRPRII